MKYNSILMHSSGFAHIFVAELIRLQLNACKKACMTAAEALIVPVPTAADNERSCAATDDMVDACGPARLKQALVSAYF